jgi:hypothetical protein
MRNQPFPSRIEDRPSHSKAGARIAAVEIALDNLLDDRPEMTVLLLETALVD